MLRLPALVLLTRAWLALLVAMVQAPDQGSAAPWTAVVRRCLPSVLFSSAPRPAPALFWSAFVSLCVAQCTTVTSCTLQQELAEEDSSIYRTGIFGFFSYLHTSVADFAPNVHVYALMSMRVFEVLGLHVLQCWARPPVPPLAWTSAVNAVVLAHFLYTVSVSDEYPSFHDTYRMMEVATLALIGLTLSLHTLTRFFVPDEARRPPRLWVPSQLPRRTDDFGLAIVKLGTACLHATRLRGLSYEMDAIEAPLHTYVELPAHGAATVHTGLVELEQAAAAGDVGALWGWRHEAKDVHVTPPATASEFMTDVRDGDRTYHQYQLASELLRLVRQLVWHVGTRLAPWAPPLPALPRWVHEIPRALRLFWHGTNGEARRAARLTREAARASDEESRKALRRELWARYQARIHAASESGWDDANDMDGMALVRLATRADDAPPDLPDVMLAHWQRDADAPPLTRSAYRALMPAGAGAARVPAADADHATQAALLRLLEERRAALRDGRSRDEYDRERARLCVVCCYEERYVIRV